MGRKNRFWLVVFAVGSLLVAGAFAKTFADEKQHDQHAAEVKVPETAAQIWHEIGEQVELLDSTITGGKLADVHRIAFTVRDLANGLPDASKDLALFLPEQEEIKRGQTSERCRAYHNQSIVSLFGRRRKST